MFEHLYNDVFPYILEFFSKLIGLTTMPVGQFIEAVGLTGLIPYTNLATGVSSTYILFGGYTLAQPLLAGIFAIMFSGVPFTAPLWLGMLLCCIEVYFVIAIIKFVAGLF